MKGNLPEDFDSRVIRQKLPQVGTGRKRPGELQTLQFRQQGQRAAQFGEGNIRKLKKRRVAEDGFPGQGEFADQRRKPATATATNAY